MRGDRHAHRTTTLWLAAGGLLLAALVLRLGPHPWNLAPIGGIAVFAGAVLGARAGVVTTLACVVATDFVIGLHDLVWATWGAFALTVLVASRLLDDRPGPIRSTMAGVCSSLGFFVLTNAAVWLQGSLYPRTFSGLVDCYVAAIPFYRGTLVGDVVYCWLLFGGWALALRVRERWEADTGWQHT